MCEGKQYEHGMARMSIDARFAERIAEEAAEWFVRVRVANVDSDVHAEWLRWIEANPANRQAFNEIQEAWDVVGQVRSPAWPNLEELRREEAAPEFPGVRHAGWTRGRRGALWAMAASVLIVLVGAIVPRLNPWRQENVWADKSERIATLRGESHTALLSDGSRIELGGLTAVRVEFTASRRLVKADEGEVFYKVAHDPKRPFVVETGAVSVTAIGTAFSVRREGEAVSIFITEGVVDVKTMHGGLTSDVQGKAGQTVRLDHGQFVSLSASALARGVGAWQPGELRFEDEPLRVVVASLNRYAPREIVLDDPELQELRFTGTVFNSGEEAWLQAAQRLFPIKIEETEHQVRITRRN
jgi:transmembrane sensor